MRLRPVGVPDWLMWRHRMGFVAASRVLVWCGVGLAGGLCERLSGPRPGSALGEAYLPRADRPWLATETGHQSFSDGDLLSAAGLCGCLCVARAAVGLPC